MQDTKARIFIFFLFIFFIIPAKLFCQPKIQWQKCIGGSPTNMLISFIQTSDGGYAGAGAIDGPNAWIVKLNKSGGIQWQRVINNPIFSQFNSIIQTSDGGYLAAGQGFTPCSIGNKGGRDAWIVKFDSLGKQQWEKCIGGTDYDGAQSIIQIPDGEYIFVGYTNSHDGDVKVDYTESWIVKLDSVGNIKWQGSLGNINISTIQANSIILTEDGGYAIAGSNTVYGQKSGDCCVAKLSSKDSVEWIKTFGGTGNDVVNSIAQTFEGNYVIAGYTESNDGDVSGNHGGRDVWIVKLNSFGNIVWQKCFGGTDVDEAFSIISISNEGYAATGITHSSDGNVLGYHGGYDEWLIKIDTAGLLEWQKCLGGSSVDEGIVVVQSSDGGYVTAGYTMSSDGDVIGYIPTPDQPIDAWVVKLSAPSIVIEQKTSSQNLSLSTYPNPTANTITLAFDLPSASPVSITIYNITGERMKDIREAEDASGHHEMQIDLGGYPAGAYFISVSACGVRERRMVQVVK